MGKISRHLLGIPLKEIRCENRGFTVVNTDIKCHIEKIGESFVYGYHAALTDNQNDTLQQSLDFTELDYRGFAYEGAGMALALLDLLTWKQKRFPQFLQKSGDAHAYMVHVGAGWAMAKIPWGRSYFNKMDQLLRWLAFDGYGFYHGYFHWPESIVKHKQPVGIKGYATQAYDQGLGRSLWFVKGAEPSVIANSILSFPHQRHADLWSGVGLAAAYAGGIENADLQELNKLSYSYQSQLAQGAAFAAKARIRAGNLANHTDSACRIFCGMSATAAAEITDLALENLTEQTYQNKYQAWRLGIQQRFS